MMPLEVANWRRHWLAADGMRWIPPEGDAYGEIVVSERRSGATSLQELLNEAAGDAGEAIHLTTVEGELATLSTFERNGCFCTRAVVCADSSQLVIEGRTRRVDQQRRFVAVTRELAVHLPLGVGQRRHRRFLYRPPVGWRAVMHGLTTDWHAGEHDAAGMIRVMPARPMNLVFHLDTLLRDDTYEGVAFREVVRDSYTLGAFKVTVARTTTDEQAFATAVLEDRSYLYVLRLSTPLAAREEHEAVFQSLVGSCEPLPQPLIEPSLSPASFTDTLHYWTA